MDINASLQAVIAAAKTWLHAHTGPIIIVALGTLQLGIFIGLKL